MAATQNLKRQRFPQGKMQMGRNGRKKEGLGTEDLWASCGIDVITVLRSVPLDVSKMHFSGMTVRTLGTRPSDLQSSLSTNPSGFPSAS